VPFIKNHLEFPVGIWIAAVYQAELYILFFIKEDRL